MNAFNLLAKSPTIELQDSQALLLTAHLQDVHAAAVAIVKATGACQLRMLGLNEQKWLPRLKRAVTLAAAIHDIGKANDHFQGMLQPESLPERKGLWQGLRHEWVSVLMAMPAFSNVPHPSYSYGSWLRPAVETDEDYLAVLWAVSGHHPKYGRPSPPRSSREGGGTTLRLFMDHDQFRNLLSWLAKAFDLPEPKLLHELVLTVALAGHDSAIAKILDFYELSHRVWLQKQREDPEFVRFVAAVKNSLVAADVAGSALPQDGNGSSELTQWIASAFESVPTPDDLAQVILDRLNANRKKALTAETLDQGLRQFQKQVGDSEARVTLVKAGCGSGKTVAAYEWARRQCAGKRLYFCYPTTGTATEGFRDYFVTRPEDRADQTTKFEAGLFHSRQELDFELLEIREDDGHSNFDEANEAAIRIESLQAWSTPIAAATCDVVLGLIQNNRRGLYGWPAFAQGAFIFDEIHAYDDRLFGALLRFLREIPEAPVLLMTASLPEARKKAIKKVLANRNENLSEIDGPEEHERLPRYRWTEQNHTELNSSVLLDQIQQELAAAGSTPEAGKVLWVCNTVDRAIAAYEAALQVGLEPLLYHSRFKYVDRVSHHREVIKAFQNKGPVLAICTQVAEMSLDLSASLLVTDMAPVPSLIQRLGRLNRRAESGSDTKPFILVQPQSADGSPFYWPYGPEDFRLTELWLRHLEDSRAKLSQRDLATAWESLPETSQRRPALVESAWLDGGPSTQMLELRESSPGVTVVFEADATEVQAGAKLGRYTIPMPPPAGKHRQQLLSPSAKKIRGCFVVTPEMIDYHEKKGAQWLRNEQ